MWTRRCMPSPDCLANTVIHCPFYIMNITNFAVMLHKMSPTLPEMQGNSIFLPMMAHYQWQWTWKCRGLSLLHMKFDPNLPILMLVLQFAKVVKEHYVRLEELQKLMPALFSATILYLDELHWKSIFLLFSPNIEQECGFIKQTLLLS